MKKICLLVALSLCVFSVKAQEHSQENQKKDEIKLNALFLVLGAFEATYEHALNEESSIGTSVFLPISEDVESVNYYVSPFYRLYFGKKYASGFFVEGFGMLNSTENYKYSFNETTFVSTDSIEDVTDFALGFGIGGKWITKRGFTLEILGGVGRNLFNSKGADYEIIGKGGINLGFRF